MNPLAYVVTLPPESQLAIGGLVGLIVLIAFNYLGTFAPWAVPFLTKWKDEISAALSGLLIGWLSNILPGGVWESTSIMGMNFVIALITGLLAYGVLIFYRTALNKK